MRSPAFDLPRLRAGLKPFKLHFFPTLKSTNSHAAALRRRGDLFAPAVVLTPRQTAGRGRGGNTWLSPAGNLTVTFAFPVEPQLNPHLLPLVAGLATRNACSELLEDPSLPLLKWPNDIVVTDDIADRRLPIADSHPGAARSRRGRNRSRLGGHAPTTSESAIGNPKSAIRKLAGLLCERLDQLDLIGIGLNVNARPAHRALRPRTTCLAELAGHPFDLTSVLLTVARHLHLTLRRRHEFPAAHFLAEYDRYHALVGRRITVLPPGDAAPITGTCQGLHATGQLIVRSAGKTHLILAGHVEAR